MTLKHPSEIRAAIQGGTAGWGQIGSSQEHLRYKMPLPKIKARRACHCGCGGKATHLGMANGVGLTRGCEMSMQRWVKTGQSKSQPKAPIAKQHEEKMPILNRQPLTEAQAEQIYKILSEECDAHPSNLLDFTLEFTSKDPCSEWRFQGSLGFGGKFRYPRMSVDCYREDETAARLKSIEAANKRLTELKATLQPLET